MTITTRMSRLIVTMALAIGITSSAFAHDVYDCPHVPAPGRSVDCYLRPHNHIEWMRTAPVAEAKAARAQRQTAAAGQLAGGIARLFGLLFRVLGR
jgi:hypothetical protein